MQYRIPKTAFDPAPIDLTSFYLTFVKYYLTSFTFFILVYKFIENYHLFSLLKLIKFDTVRF